MRLPGDREGKQMKRQDLSKSESCVQAEPSSEQLKNLQARLQGPALYPRFKGTAKLMATESIDHWVPAIKP